MKESKGNQIAPDYLIANVASFNAFAVTKDIIQFNKNGITLTKAAAQAIKVKKGQRVRIVKTKG